MVSSTNTFLVLKSTAFSSWLKRQGSCASNRFINRSTWGAPTSCGAMRKHVSGRSPMIGRSRSSSGIQGEPTTTSLRSTLNCSSQGSCSGASASCATRSTRPSPVQMHGATWCRRRTSQDRSSWVRNRSIELNTFKAEDAHGRNHHISSLKNPDTTATATARSLS